MLKRILAVAVLAAVAGGCGGSDPGGGSKTLYVVAEFSTDGTPDNSFINVLVREGSDGGPIVQDAIVVVAPEGGSEFSVPYQSGFGFVNRYIKNQIPWAKSFRIRITRPVGSDRVEALIESPGLTTIQSVNTPFNRAANQPLVVTWNDSFGRKAMLAEVRIEDGSFSNGQKVQTLRPDPGSVSIPTTTWNQTTNDEQLHFTRTNELSLAGGTAGSRVTASTFASSNEFAVQ